MPTAHVAVPASVLPPIVLSVFEGPLDLLLHLIREHKIEIANIPIAQITDHYLAYLRAMEALNLTVAGDFLVMAATLLEIKSRMLLPKSPRDLLDTEETEDPREALVQKLLDYQRYKAFVETLSGWEDDRRRLFFRGQAAYGDLYELPVSFGELKADSLLNALTRLLNEVGVSAEHEITTVRRQKMTLRLAMAALWRKVQQAGEEGIAFEECFERPFVRLEIILTFLALLELLRQGHLKADQSGLLSEIRLSSLARDSDHAAH